MEETDAKKVRFDENAVWDLVRKYKSIVIAKGKAFVELEPSENNRETILKEAMGRSGNLRAPSVVLGEKLFVGFSEPMYLNMFHKVG